MYLLCSLSCILLLENLEIYEYLQGCMLDWELVTVEAVSCSWNRLEVIWSLSCCVVLLDVSIRRRSTVVMKGWTWSAATLRELRHLKRCTDGTKGHKVGQENTPHIMTPPAAAAWAADARQDGSMISCSHQVLTIPSKYYSRIRESSDQATSFQSSVVASISFLCWHERHLVKFLLRLAWVAVMWLAICINMQLSGWI